MFISALEAHGYRNLEGLYPLCAPLSVLVGENNAGKSNVIDGLRAVLEPEAGPRARNWITPSDFRHDGHGVPEVTELELAVHLTGLGDDAQGRMVTCRSPSRGADTAIVRLKATLGAGDRIQTQWIGGDSENGEPDRHSREGVRFVYLHPLRDAASDLRPGKDNKLVSLIKALAPGDHPDRAAIELAARTANEALDTIRTIVDARRHVDTRLAAMTGKGRFVQHSGLAFADPRFERVVGSLRAKIGELAALEMEENGLGYNNLLYMAVLLAAIADAPQDVDPTLRVLLVEEPEAHLHPQLQELLMRFLETEAVDRTQVIVTTHSPTFTSSAKVERLTVLARTAPEPGADAATGDEAGSGSEVEQPVSTRPRPRGLAPRDFGLEPKQLDYLHRFLDVTKSSLFFARAVILVEGVAEQLLVPVVADYLQRPLAPNGVSVVNVGGVAFPPFTDLFGPDRLPYRLAVISDSDGDPPAEDLEDADPNLSPRARGLQERSSGNVLVKLATRTLEWDLAQAGNEAAMVEALTRVKPRVGAGTREAIEGLAPNARADLILEKVDNVKGRFAQELAEIWSTDGTMIHVPDYLREAIEWVADELPPETT